MGFPTRVNGDLPVGVAGDFASANPRVNALAGEGTIVADTGGCSVGRFAWVVSGKASSAGSGVPTGFVHRSNNALITEFLGEASFNVPVGLPVTVFIRGDFWAKTLTIATVGQKVFASLTTGEVKTGAAGATVSGYIETSWVVASAAAANELIKITAWG